MTIVSKMELKFCEDCKWYRLRDNKNPEFARCAHPDCPAPGSSNLVSRQVREGLYCSSARGGICGKEARFFEEREIVRLPSATSWWRRALGFT